MHTSSRASFRAAARVMACTLCFEIGAGRLFSFSWTSEFPALPLLPVLPVLPVQRHHITTQGVSIFLMLCSHHESHAWRVAVRLISGFKTEVGAKPFMHRNDPIERGFDSGMHGFVVSVYHSSLFFLITFMIERHRIAHRHRFFHGKEKQVISVSCTLSFDGTLGDVAQWSFLVARMGPWRKSLYRPLVLFVWTVTQGFEHAPLSRLFTLVWHHSSTPDAPTRRRVTYMYRAADRKTHIY